jgi:heme exporter protein B
MTTPELTSGQVRKKPRYFETIGAIIWKDVMIEVRSREILSAMLVFALLVIIIFNFALELDPQGRHSATAGILWVTFAFAGTLGLNRSMAMEKDRASLEGLLLAPVERSAILIGKTISNLFFMVAVEAMVIPVYSLLYNINLLNPGLWLVFLLGSTGYATTGTLLASMVIQTRTRDVLLPILLFPVAIPILLIAVKATGLMLLNSSFSGVQIYILMLVAFDLLYIAAALMTSDFIFDE